MNTAPQLLAFRAHITTAAGASLRLGILATGQRHATALIDGAVPGNRGAQLRCLGVAAAPAANAAFFNSGARA